MVIDDACRKILFDQIQHLKIDIQNLSSIVQNPINITSEIMREWNIDRNKLNTELDNIEDSLKYFAN